MDLPRGSTVLIVAWASLAALVGTVLQGVISGVVLALVSPFALVTVWMFGQTAARLRTWVRLGRQEASAVEEPGFVEVEGTARPLSETLQSPGSDVDCLAYRYEREAGEGDQREDTVPFVVESDGQSVAVSPAGARLSFEPEGEAGERREQLDVGESVYVAGTAVRADEASIRVDGQEFVIERPTSELPDVFARLTAAPFIVSEASEEGTAGGLLVGALSSLVFGVLSALPWLPAAYFALVEGV